MQNDIKKSKIKKSSNAPTRALAWVSAMATLCFLGFLTNLAVATNTTTPSPPATNTVKKVFISQVVEHPALNAATQGILDALAEAGYQRDRNLNVRIESAQGNAALASQIASKFVNQNPDVVVGVGTVSAQSFAQYAAKGKVKLVFSSVTDPLGASLVATLDKPGNHTSGVSNFVALEPQLQLFKTLQPSLKRLGILYNPGELNSVSLVNALDALCPSMGLTLVKQTITKTADATQAALKLSNQVDALFISNDNTALSSLQAIIKAANRKKIPVYVSDTDAVALGALAALGPNQYAIGQQTGRLIANLLNGASIDAQPVAFPAKTELYLNGAVAQALGIPLPDALRQSATRIIDKAS